MESLALCGPRRLGTLQRGLSAWSILPQVETATYGGSSHRKLFGCAITMLDASVESSHAGAAGLPLASDHHDGVAGNVLACASGSGCKMKLFQQLLLTWSKVNQLLLLSVCQLHADYLPLLLNSIKLLCCCCQLHNAHIMQT